MQMMDNQSGFIQVGSGFPYVSSATGKDAVVQTIEYQHVGLTMRVTPRISPDGKVLMRVEPTVSSVNPTPADTSRVTGLPGIG